MNILPVLAFVFFFSIVFIVIVITGIMSFKQKDRWKSIGKNEISEIENYCKKNGLEYRESSNYIPKCSEVFSLIQENITYVNYKIIMIGKMDDIEYSILDLNYSAGKNSRHYITLCLLSKEEVSLPEFTLFFKSHYLFNSAGHELEVFSNNKNLSNSYCLETDDTKSVKELFDLDLCNILAESTAKEYEFETKAEYLLTFAQGDKNLNERLSMLEQSMKFYKAMLKKIE